MLLLLPRSVVRQILGDICVCVCVCVCVCMCVCMCLSLSFSFYIYISNYLSVCVYAYGLVSETVYKFCEVMLTTLLWLQEKENSISVFSEL